MTPQMILDRMDQIIRIGFVNARQPETMRVKVTLPDTVGAPLVTDFLPVICPRACGDMQYDLPDVGDQVLVLFLAYGLEQGFVVGSMFGKQKPPVQSGDKWHRTFRDGTTLEYDRSEHKLTANVQGDVEITATGNLKAEIQGELAAKSQGPASVESQAQLSLAAPAMNMGGPGGGATNSQMRGNFNLTDGDIVAEMISLRSHTHICPACGAETSPPVGGGDGGSGESGGNEIGETEGDGSGDNSDDGNSGQTCGEDSGNGENGQTGGNLELPAGLAAALAASGFAMTKEREAWLGVTKKKVHLQDNEVFDTILCLPRIAENEARNSSGENRLGWVYLKQMFEKWLSGEDNTDPFANGEPFWVSMDWILSYMRAKALWNMSH